MGQLIWHKVVAASLIAVHRVGWFHDPRHLLQRRNSFGRSTTLRVRTVCSRASGAAVPPDRCEAGPRSILRPDRLDKWLVVAWMLISIPIRVHRLMAASDES